VNILFVNYGDFTTNSLNHIAGFANTLCAMGHSCVVAIQGDPKSIAQIANPLFIGTTYEELLAKPAFFPNGRPADIVHAWTPRECVRRFILGYQPLGKQLYQHSANNQILIERARLIRTVGHPSKP